MRCEILKNGWDCQRTNKEKFQMVENLKNQFPVGRLCDQIGINYQLYRLYARGEIGLRAQQSKHIKSKMLEVFDESRQTYGLDRMLPALRS